MVDYFTDTPSNLTPTSRPGLVKQGSSISIGDSSSFKNKTSDIQRKKMLEPKTNGKGSYVKKKKIEIDYATPDYQMKELDMKYDIISIISKINQSHTFQSRAAAWVISELQKRKTQLPPKAFQILSSPGLSVETMMRLLNLKNCVHSV